MSFFERRVHMCYRNDNIFFIIFGDEKYPKNSLYADCPSRVYGCGRRPPGASMPPNLGSAASHKSGSVVVVANARHACPGCAPLTNGAAAGTWRGETDASGLHGVDVAVGLARMLLPGVWERQPSPSNGLGSAAPPPPPLTTPSPFTHLTN